MNISIYDYCSGRDQWLLNEEDIDRYSHALPKCIVRKLKDNGHFLFFVSDLSLSTKDDTFESSLDTYYN